jgi:hypothetical protein
MNKLRRGCSENSASEELILNINTRNQKTEFGQKIQEM